MQFHHVVANSRTNRKVYGNERIQSVKNGRLCCQKDHDNHSSWDTEIEKQLLKEWAIYSKSKLNGQNHRHTADLLLQGQT